MLAVISPAKTLDFDSDLPSHRPTKPAFLDEAGELVSILRKKTRPQLQELMSISPKLADLNFSRYRSFSTPFTEDNARSALFAFKGDVYTGFDLDLYGSDDLHFAQQHLRILSGLYGMLRPLDLIQPYRLEMGTDLKNPRGKNLYDYWGSSLAKALNQSVKKSGSQTLINLASKEYFSAIPASDLNCHVVTPHFKDLKNGSYKIVSFYAKKARGMMCDFMIRNRLQDPADLKDFDREGYRYNSSLSSETDLVFTRDKPPVAA